MTPSQARQAYVDQYERGLTDLGYTYVLQRRITRPGGRLVYHLLFATDSDVGERIMAHVFQTMYPNRPQLELPL